MPTKSLLPVTTLNDLSNGQEADLFLMLASKEELKTRDGKPYFKVAFRDGTREVSFPLWQDSAFMEECRKHWTPGAFYKVRAVYRDSSYGPQLELRKIRETCDADAADGFDPSMFRPQSRFDPQRMYAEIVELANEQISDEALRTLVVDIYEAHREQLLAMPAATRNHHAFAGGYLEHVLSVTRTCVFLAAKYDDYYPEMQPRLNKDLVIAGALLHDIGKTRELDWQPAGPAYTAAGNLIGHILQGRDILREAAAGRALDPDVLLRLEHVIVSHQRLPEWGSPKPPMTPEAMLVHVADDLDAKYAMLVGALRDDTTSGPVTSKKNILMQHLYRGDA